MTEQIIDTTLTYGVLGLGKSGASVFRWLKSRGFEKVIGFDTQYMSPEIESLQKRYVGADFQLGDFADEALLAQIDVWIVSPGINVAERPFVKWIGGKPVWNDIELFARVMSLYEQQPKVIGITGSNGKSTVTKMVEHLLNKSGVSAKAVGNIGLPVLDLLNGSELPDVVVMELSSFQLEHIRSLRLEVATVLNLSEDHLDRHKTMARYAQAKGNIFAHAERVVINLDDADSLSLLPEHIDHKVSFSLKDYNADYFYNAMWKTLVSNDLVFAQVRELPFEGTHNYANALAALGLIQQIGLDASTVVDHLKTFEMLPHRMSVVDTCGGVRWINDSKSTNVGSTLASVMSYAEHVHLILGGLPKGQDFSPLTSEAVLSRCDSVQLIGEVAKTLLPLFAKQIKALGLDHDILVEKQPDLSAVIQRIGKISVDGGVALFSPACSSFDMFENFEDRGHQFMAVVHAHCAQFPDREVA